MLYSLMLAQPLTKAQPVPISDLDHSVYTTLHECRLSDTLVSLSSSNDVTAHFGGAAALLGMAFSEGNTNASITLYMIAVTLNCCIYMGFNVNHLDLTPNFARILMGISNGSANITAIIAPLFVGAVVKDEVIILTL